ncbi:MAG: PAS domain S-box protein, partial [Phycisphaerae bacterium]|nr:PAS domain S-box protein [Phycisphaerae bacterium]
MADALKLLVVDDTEIDRMAVRRALMRAHLDAEIQEACDVRSALDILGREPFDCAIIDYHLPDGDGLEILQGPGRANGGLPPIIILTGHGSETLAVDFMKAGASDYLPKAELTPGRIEQSVRNAIRVHQAERMAQASREQVQASEKRFRDLFENSPDAVFVEDLEGRVLDVNPAACALHGLSREQLAGRRVEDLVPERHREQVLKGFAQFVSGERTQAEGFSLGPDGREVPVEVRCRRIEFSHRPALLLHVRDITELKEARDRLEQRVAERTAELSEANIALQREMAERQEAEERAGQLYEQLTHAARLSSMGEMAAG